MIHYGNQTPGEESPGYFQSKSKESVLHFFRWGSATYVQLITVTPTYNMPEEESPGPIFIQLNQEFW